MDPGSELDIAVAKIMGWTNIDGIEGDDPDGDRWIILNYSTSMNAAMRAFEWLEENSPWFRICLQRNNEGKPAVYRHILPHGHRVEVASATTYPHAICLAAIAVGGK